MGLDNGIIITNLNKEDYKLFKITDEDINKDGSIELCYWRKCWGIRDAILSILDPILKNKEEGKFIIECEDIPVIIRKFSRFFSKEYWDENSQSIWEFEEMFLSNLKYIIRLSILEDYMKEHPELEVYFYDSY